jgi:hypothetical protein
MSRRGGEAKECTRTLAWNASAAARDSSSALRMAQLLAAQMRAVVAVWKAYEADFNSPAVGLVAFNYAHCL